MSIRTGRGSGGERPASKSSSKARRAGRRRPAGETPSVRRGGDPVFSQQRERDGWLRSGLKGRAGACPSGASLHGKELLPGGEVCGAPGGTLVWRWFIAGT